MAMAALLDRPFAINKPLHDLLPFTSPLPFPLNMRQGYARNVPDFSDRAVAKRIRLSVFTDAGDTGAIVGPSNQANFFAANGWQFYY